MKKIIKNRYEGFDIRSLSAEGRAEMLRLLDGEDGYVTGGYTALLNDRCGFKVTRN